MISKISGPKVLLIEKNNHISELLQSCFSNHNVCLDRVRDIEAIPSMLCNKYVLLIIDINLTLNSNIIAITKIRAHNLFLPIIAIGPNNQIQKIQSCNLGINVYHYKPIDCELLKAQIAQQTSFLHKNVILEVGNIKIDLATQSFFINHKKIIFTYQEFHLLLLLIKAEGRTISRDKICNYFSGNNKDVSYAAVDTLISRIRSKLNKHLDKPFIKTKYKLGYLVNTIYLKDCRVEKIRD